MSEITKQATKSPYEQMVDLQCQMIGVLGAFDTSVNNRHIIFSEGCVSIGNMSFDHHDAQKVKDALCAFYDPPRGAPSPEATAPELLEALEEMTTLASKGFNSITKHHAVVFTPNVEERIEAARAIIAKAKGE